MEKEEKNTKSLLFRLECLCVGGVAIVFGVVGVGEGGIQVAGRVGG